MPTFLRRIVSGPKARHVDKALGVDLDLVYVTDRLIIMGWPASSVAALYRNKRKSVRRFLDAKHGEKYRVYNLCPASENWYDPGEFYGCVSRYPFPDHHPPPLSMIPMFVCDVTAWLAEDPENVAVIHCKAGKGRSGTMACSYLLSLPILPSPPAGEEHASAQESKIRDAEETGEPLAASRGASSVIEESRQMLDGLDPVMLGNLLAEHPKVQKEQDKPLALKNGANEDDNGQVREDARRASAAAAAVGDFHTAYTADALAERMYAVFEMHTARRLKPAKMSATASSSGVNSVSDSSPNDSQAALAFLQQDPTANKVPLSPKQKRLGRSKSVADLWRHASGGFRRGSAPQTLPSALAMSKAEASSESDDVALDSTNSSPPRSRSPLRSPRRDLHALGVQPMGRSTVDLTLASATPERRPSFGALVQGWASTPSVARRPSSPLDREASPASNNDGAVSPTTSRLAPPLFQPGQSAPANSSSDQPISYSRMASTSQLSLGTGGNNRFSAAATHIDDLMADGEEEEDDEQSVPRLAVSIPSQRRFVGYWARILSGKDPREPLLCPTGQAPRRTIRITRILVDRREKASGNGGSVSVQLGRYDHDLEGRLHSWEVNARRRTRAYRFADPSAATPGLPNFELTEHGTDFRGPLRRRQEREAEEKQWKHVAEQNEPTGYQRRVAQHGNEHGVGCWGINVLAEEERVRTFAWTKEGSRGQDDEHHGMTAAEVQAQKEAAKRETEIETLAMLKESDRKVVRPQANSSSVDAQYITVRHKFSLEDNADVKLGGPGLPTWLKGSSQRASPRPSQEKAVNHTDRSNNTSSSGSSLHGVTRNGQEHEETTPHTSVESALGGALGQGVVVDADHALQIKLLSGRSGASHARLPDMAASGYLWFIPSFETPDGSCVPGERIRRSFTAAEIDFRKSKQAAKLVGGEVRRVTVEWEWIETGSAGWNDDSDGE